MAAAGSLMVRLESAAFAKVRKYGGIPIGIKVIAHRGIAVLMQQSDRAIVQLHVLTQKEVDDILNLEMG